MIDLKDNKLRPWQIAISILAITSGNVGSVHAQVLAKPDQTSTSEARCLSLHNVHTNDRLHNECYYRDGQYDPAALQKLDYLMRDENNGEWIQMNPFAYDTLWKVQQHYESKEIQIVSGFRTIGTTDKNHKKYPLTTAGRDSQHIKGNAIDFRVPGVKPHIVSLYTASLHAGGVGDYPNAANLDTHEDCGPERYWPGGFKLEVISKRFKNAIGSAVTSITAPIKKELQKLPHPHRKHTSPRKTP